MEMELKTDILNCEICNKEGGGVYWDDGEYTNRLCFKCINKAKNGKDNNNSNGN